MIVRLKAHHVKYLRWCFCAFVLLAITAAELAAQQSNVRWRHLTIEDGLSQSIAFSIVQDLVGFIWVGTEDGLNRYDGYEFEVYVHDPQDPTSISDNYISALHIDRSGTLWVGTWRRGLNRYCTTTDSFTRFQHDPTDPSSISEDRITSIGEDHTGTIWICTESAGLNRLHPETGVVTRYRHQPTDPNSLAADQTRGVVVDQEGVLWIATQAGLDRFEAADGTFTHYRHDAADPSSLGNDRIESIAIDHEGDLWIGTSGGILDRFDRSSNAFVHYWTDPRDPLHLGGRRIMALYTDPTIWVGTEGGGLRRYDHRTDTFVTYRHDPRIPGSLGGDRIRSIFQDRGGVLWVGVWGAGLSRLNRGTCFAHYHHVPDSTNSLINNGVFSIYQDRAGAIWIGTYGSGLDLFDWTEGTFLHHLPQPESPSGLSHGDVRAILEDSQGNLWIGTFGGLNRMDRGTGRFIRYLHDENDPDSLGEDRVFTLAEDHDGYLWIGTFGGGLDRFDRASGTFTHFRHDPTDRTTISDNDVRTIHEDSQGTLWIGTWNGGLNRMDRRTGIFERFRHDPGDAHSISSDSVYHIYEDPDGALWLATRGGINRLNPHDAAITFHHFTTEQGLPDDMVYGIVPDNENNLWLSTNHGLARFDPESGSVDVFDVRDGLQSNEFNSGAFARLHTGELLFGGVNGLSLFDPDEIRVFQAPPKIVVTSIRRFHGDRVETLPVPTDGRLELSYRDDFVSFEFAALDFAVPERNTYSYLLEGKNEEWFDLGTRREITFADLSHGDYVLHVRGTSGVGAGTGNPIAINLFVAPPPWATTWFRLVVGGLLLALGYGVHRIRTAVIREHAHKLQAEVERERLHAQLQQAQKMEAVGQLTGGLAHDFNNLLTVIAANLELISYDMEAEDPSQECVEDALSAVNRGAALTHRLLAFSRKQTLQPRPVSLQQLVTGMESLLRRTLGETIEIDRISDEGLWICEVDPTQVETALLNLAVNARDAMPDGGRLTIITANISHSTAQISEDQDMETGDFVLLGVKDTGMGMSQEVLSQVFDPFFTTKEVGKGSGLGLSMVYGFVTQSGGHVEINSTEGEGTTVNMFFPRSEATAPDSPRDTTASTARGKGELVLVVEDDPAVRAVTLAMLGRLGYQTLEAASGPAALEAIKGADAEISLLFTDVVLPDGMSGVELARLVREYRPEMSALFTSGYAQDVILKHGGLESRDQLIEKPFSSDELARKISAALKGGR
jgi:ligand-binding sensor domain-containing protein